MKITTEPTKSGLSIKIYIPKSELDKEKFSNLTNDFSKDFRMQRTFREKYSKAKKDLIIYCLYEIFENYDVYNDIWQYDKGVREDIVTTKIYNSLKDKLDDYQKDSFDSISKVLFAVAFNEETELKVDTIKEDYSLSEKDLLVSTIGSFGFGKTTLIKKMLNFGDDFVFPLVDKGRTTINNCYFRGMLVTEKDGEKFIQGVPIEKYRFKNVIKLIDCSSFYQNILAIKLIEAFKIYVDKQNDRECLSKFVNYDKCKLDEFFGDIDEYLTNKQDKSFYKVLIDEFKNIYQRYISDSENLDVQSYIFENSILQDALEEEYNKKILSGLDEIKKETGNESILYKNNKITFELQYDDIGSIDDYYYIFISNSIASRGRLLRIIVKEIFSELDLDTEEINKVKGIKDKYDSLVMIDTIGCGHTANKAENSQIKAPNNDIMQNTALLNQCDVILLLENAQRSMDKDILTQIVSLDSFGYKSNTILVYSHYNQFVKNDFKDDKEREKYLLDTLEGKLEEAFYSTKSKAKIIYDTFTSEHNKQLVFLKGLVPYISESKTKTVSNGSTRVKKSSKPINEIASEEEMAKRLNVNIENSTDCLVELFNKIMTTSERAKEMSSKRITIDSNIDETDAIMSFSEYFKVFVDEYLKQQKQEYIVYTPEYNTSAALCRIQSKGGTEFEGVGRTLSPFNDSITTLMQKFNEFVENGLNICIEKDEDGNKLDSALKDEFIKDVVKNSFSQKIQKLYKIMLITGNRDRWIKISNDSGSGVKTRRANSIYQVIEQTYDSKVLREQSWESVEKAVKEMIEEYGSN